MNIKEEIARTREVKAKDGFGYSYIQRKNEIPPFLGNNAKHDLNSIVYAYSVGFKNIYQPFLERVVAWLRQGIEEQEDFGEFIYHQYELTSSLAFATWLKTGINNIELWNNSLKWQNDFYNNIENNPSFIEEEELALQILHYIQAQEYEKGILLYQSIKGDKSLILKHNIRGYCIAYAYCLHFYEGKFTVEQLEEASRNFLGKHLVMLYTMGRSTEMLYWLKMICDARKETYTPEEVIYTFYEYIPEEEKPDFIKELLGKKTRKKSFCFFLKW